MNHYLKMLLLLWYGPGDIKTPAHSFTATQDQAFEKHLKRQKTEEYKKYFKQQEEFYKELLKLKIPGACPLDMDEALAESVLATCPKEVNQAIFDIKENLFCANEKNIMLHGVFGTSKSALAQAIAIKNQIPCLFFNVEEILTMNSGVQNLSRIFEYVKGLEKDLKGKPCIIIFDDLEALTKKNVGQNNYENNNLIRFWKQLDKLRDSKVFVIGTMNRTEDLPVEITAKASMIEIPLPNLKHREIISDYYLKAEKNAYKFIYPEWVTPTWIAQQTEGFSHIDVQNLVMRATKLARSNRSNEFDSVIEQMKNEPQRKLVREMRTWKYAFKAYSRDPRALGVAGLVVSLTFLYNNRKSLAFQEKGQIYQKRGLDMQEKAMSADHMAKQALMNSSVMGIPVGLPLYMAFRPCGDDLGSRP